MFSLSECSTVAQASRSLGRAPRSARRCSAAPARPVSVRAEGSNNGSDGVFKDAKFGDKPLWQRVHLTEDRGTSSPAVPVSSSDEGPSTASTDAIPKASAPLWQQAHFKKDEPMWKKVNATRDPADAVVSAAAVKTAAAEESAGPKQLDVAAAPPPLWASVHLGKKDEASKMWQTVTNNREGGLQWPFAKPAEEEAPAGAKQLEIADAGQAPAWQRVHSGKATGEEVRAAAAAAAPAAAPKAAPPRGAATIAAAKPDNGARNIIFAVVFGSIAAMAALAPKAGQKADAAAAPKPAKAAVSARK